MCASRVQESVQIIDGIGTHESILVSEIHCFGWEDYPEEMTVLDGSGHYSNLIQKTPNIYSFLILLFFNK